MTNYNNTDKIIREKFESLDPVFDAESMWGELAPMVERKKRRGFFFWLLSGIVIGVFSLAGLSYLNSESLDSSITENAMAEYNSQSSLSPTVNNISSEDEVLTNVNSGSSTQFSQPQKQLSFASVEKDVKEVNVNSKSLFDNANNSSELVANVISAEEGSDKSMIGKDNIIDNTFKKEDILHSEILNVVDRNLGQLEKLPAISLSTLKFRNNIEGIDGPEFANDIYTQPLPKKEWRIAINGGYYIHSRSFENNGTDDSDNYSYRSVEEEAKDGYDLGIKLEYFLSEHFVLVGGVRFSQSFVQRSTEYTYTETITLEDHVVAIINTEDGPKEIIDNITYDGIFIHKADNYITATRLGLITGLQYRLRADRWTTHLDFGFEIPVWDSHSGVITNNRRPYDLSDDDQLINSSSLQVYGGIGVEYSLTSKTALQATIGGFVPLNNEHVESYEIEKKSSLLGLNLGVHFRL